MIYKSNGISNFIREQIASATGNSVFLRYFEILCEFSGNVNVMSMREIEKGYRNFVIFHIVDSLTACYAVNDWSGKKIVDIGSGAGLPGVPIYIIKEKELESCSLIEARGSKIAFLTHLKADMRLDRLDIQKSRAETAAHEDKNREKYDISLIRAVGSVEECLELSLPFLKIGGLSVLYRGKLLDKDVEFSTKAASKFGGKLENTVNYFLEGAENDRNLLIFRKTCETEKKYPRREGIPRKRSKQDAGNVV